MLDLPPASLRVNDTGKQLEHGSSSKRERLSYRIADAVGQQKLSQGRNLPVGLGNWKSVGED
jgi:hypothetical protein